MPQKSITAEDLPKRLLRIAHEEVEAEIRQCLDEWLKAVGSGAPEPVAVLYHPDAVLLATFDPMPLTTPEERKSYFANFTRKKDLKAIADTCHIHVFSEDAAGASGLYTFRYVAENGEEMAVNARFTFNFIRDREDDRWLIVSHHSSQAPKSAP